MDATQTKAFSLESVGWEVAVDEMQWCESLLLELRARKNYLAESEGEDAATLSGDTDGLQRKLLGEVCAEEQAIAEIFNRAQKRERHGCNRVRTCLKDQVPKPAGLGLGLLPGRTFAIRNLASVEPSEATRSVPADKVRDSPSGSQSCRM